jgi:bifunctional non-homologous end joining protein LigD
VNGYDTTSLELRHRKAILRRLLSFQDPLRLNVHRNAEGEAFWQEACRKGWEGVIAKRADASYEHKRSSTWLKFKCVNEQEFVIGGYTDPKGSRKGFGGILIGYFEAGRLRYAGKVGTGFDDQLLSTLSRQLASIEQDRPPFDGNGLPRKGSALGEACPCLSGRIHRVDSSRAAPPPSIPGPQEGQAASRCGQGASGLAAVGFRW